MMGKLLQFRSKARTIRLARDRIQAVLEIEVPRAFMRHGLNWLWVSRENRAAFNAALMAVWDETLEGIPHAVETAASAVARTERI